MLRADGWFVQQQRRVAGRSPLLSRFGLRNTAAESTSCLQIPHGDGSTREGLHNVRSNCT
jgi:hypothetical protein